MAVARREKACRFRQAFFVLVSALWCTACAGGSPLDSRQEIADKTARSAHLEPVRFRAGPFEILGYRQYRRAGTDALSVFIEGDGLAWNAFGTAPSADPTPRDPVGLRLAAADPAANRLYLARPCQYQSKVALARCSYQYWTSHRFAEEVVEGFAEIVAGQAHEIGARQIHLVGYSGGGALAALIAPRLPGQVTLVTIAAPLDHAYWTRLMHISPMTASLNPADLGTRLAKVPQVHFVSPDDEVVPPQVAQSYLAALGDDASRVKIVPVEGADHWCCWPRLWPQLRDSVVFADN